MIISKIINKLFRTTLFMFLILCVFTITNYNNEKVLRTNIEINNIEEIPETIIYLLSDDNYLVKTNIYLENDSIETKANKIIEFLKTNNNKLPSGLNGYLLNNININKIDLESNNLIIDFSKEFMNIKNKELVITGLVYSLTNLSNVDTIEIFVENNYIENYNYKLDKNIGINKDYLLNDRKDIKKVTVFYYNKINNTDYLTPVTKYVNDSREKVEIIIEELSENVPDNLIGYLSDKVKLIDYQEENDMMILNFSENFKNSNELINQKTMNLISQSIFDNYDLEMVLFQENSQKIDYIKKKQ